MAVAVVVAFSVRMSIAPRKMGVNHSTQIVCEMVLSPMRMLGGMIMRVPRHFHERR